MSQILNIKRIVLLLEFVLMHEIFSQSYLVRDTLLVNHKELRLYYGTHHFLTLIEGDGTYNIRTHPGCDPNGWGTSWYFQPFLPGAHLNWSQIDQINLLDSTVLIQASGLVSKDSLQSYGDWNSSFEVQYFPNIKRISGSGKVTIILDDQLNDSIGDLNLFKIASNILCGVPIIDSDLKDTTGDLDSVNVFTNTSQFSWQPCEQPSHFPQESFDSININVAGAYNNVDTKKQGFDSIAPAFKPSLDITVKGMNGVMFGGVLDQSIQTLDGNGALDTIKLDTIFWVDNIGITPIIPKSDDRTIFSYDFTMESYALEEESFCQVLNITPFKSDYKFYSDNLILYDLLGRKLEKLNHNHNVYFK